MTSFRFRILVVISIILALSAGLYDWFWADSSTNLLVTYARELNNQRETNRLIVSSAALLVATIWLIASSIGLMLFKNWGRVLYPAGFIAFIPLYLQAGTTILSPMATVLAELSNLVSGAIIAVSFYSRIAGEFSTSRVDKRGREAG